MKLSELKKVLESVSEINFIQPNGHFIPRHFHITEAGLITRNFIDCGGTVRHQKSINLQIWTANDYEHRLTPEKLNKIIDLAAPLFLNEDLEVEAEFQAETIGRYGIDFNGRHFLLTAKQTACLAEDACGIPAQKKQAVLKDLKPSSTGCCGQEKNCC